MLSSISITVSPIGTSAMYIPVASVVKVKMLPSLSVMTTSTPSIGGSPGSCSPLLLASSKTVPLTLPVGVGVGAAVGVEVGVAVGEPVGVPVGEAVGEPVGLQLATRRSTSGRPRCKWRWCRFRIIAKVNEGHGSTSGEGHFDLLDVFDIDFKRLF